MTKGDKRSLRDVVRDLLAYPLPKGIGWSHVFGSLLLTSFVVQVVTGALLALYYSPSAGEAWESVSYIENEVRAGSLIRGVHHFGSSSFIVLLVVHVARVFLWGAYKKRRKWTWVVGCLLLFCVLGFGFTGYLLPWDLRAFFGTRVGVEIAGSAPLVGDAIKRLLAGGAGVGELTLTRFYALHAVILPLVTTLLIALHLTLLRLHGPARSWRHDKGESGKLFHPHQTAKDVCAGLLLVLGLLGAAWLFEAPLGEKADPQNTSYVPRPEWYFLGLQQLLRIFQGSFELVGSVVLPALGVALLFLLPWIDRNPDREPRRRPVALSAGAFALLGLIVLTVWGERELRAEERAMEERLAAQADAPPPEDVVEPPPPNEAELVARGKLLYRELACAGCHGARNRGPDTPSIDFEGSMVKRDWLRAYMADPVRIRFGTEGGHPVMRMPDFRLDEAELDAMTAYLMSLRDPEKIADRGFDDAPTTAEVDEGKLLFDDFDCLSCHVLEGEGEDLGPRLDGVARRLTPDYMAALILDPEGVVPGTSMTDFYMEEAEARAIVRFLQTLR